MITLVITQWTNTYFLQIYKLLQFLFGIIFLKKKNGTMWSDLFLSPKNLVLQELKPL